MSVRLGWVPGSSGFSGAADVDEDAVDEAVEDAVEDADEGLFDAGGEIEGKLFLRGVEDWAEDDDDDEVIFLPWSGVFSFDLRIVLATADAFAADILAADSFVGDEDASRVLMWVEDGILTLCCGCCWCCLLSPGDFSCCICCCCCSSCCAIFFSGDASNFVSALSFRFRLTFGSTNPPWGARRLTRPRFWGLFLDDEGIFEEWLINASDWVGLSVRWTLISRPIGVSKGQFCQIRLKLVIGNCLIGTSD